MVVVPADPLLSAHKGDATRQLQVIKEEMDALAQNLAPYKRPTRVFLFDGELPKTATRKVKRPLVAEWLKSQN